MFSRETCAVAARGKRRKCEGQLAEEPSCLTRRVFGQSSVAVGIPPGSGFYAGSQDAQVQNVLKEDPRGRRGEDRARALPAG